MRLVFHYYYLENTYIFHVSFFKNKNTSCVDNKKSAKALAIMKIQPLIY